MMDKKLLAYVNGRLRQIKGNRNDDFAKVSVLAVGDFYQLPPVRQQKPLCVPDDANIDLFNGNFCMFELNEIMGQKEDRDFALLLNRLRVKKKLEHIEIMDENILMSRVRDESECPLDALHIFPTNAEVNLHNKKALLHVNTDVVKIDAEDYSKDQRTGHMKKHTKPVKGTNNDLCDVLEVACGARVMLTRNLDVSCGLVNGAFGTFTDVRLNKTHHTLCVKYDSIDIRNRHFIEKYNPDENGSIAMERVEENMHSTKAIRRQFPVKLAFACTIHKVQGMSLDKAVVSLQKVFESGMAYVALSRVTSLDGLFILKNEKVDDVKKIYCNENIHHALTTMTRLSHDHLHPLLNLSKSSDQTYSIRIVHHNIEGLLSHLADMTSHSEFMLADVLCLSETWLNKNQVSPSQSGYQMFRRDRADCYEKSFPGDYSNKQGGGIAVCVRDNICVTNTISDTIYSQVRNLEFIITEIQTPRHLLLVTVYRPPQYEQSDFLKTLEVLVKLISNYKTVVLVGDLNEDCLSHKMPIRDLLSSYRYHRLITQRTKLNETLLDVIYMKNLPVAYYAGVLQSYYSYHEPVYVAF